MLILLPKCVLYCIVIILIIHFIFCIVSNTTVTFCTSVIIQESCIVTEQLLNTGMMKDEIFSDSINYSTKL